MCFQRHYHTPTLPDNLLQEKARIILHRQSKKFFRQAFFSKKACGGSRGAKPPLRGSGRSPEKGAFGGEMMKTIRRVICGLLAAAVFFAGCTAYADEPYVGYNYDCWGDPVPSQNGYVVDKIISGSDIGCGELASPSDFFFSEDDELYIVDSGFTNPIGRDQTQRGRIIITDKNFKLLNTIAYLDFSDLTEWLEDKWDEYLNREISEERYNKETNSYFSSPAGVFVKGDNIYVADTDNNRVVMFKAAVDKDGNGVGKVVKVFTRPDEAYYDTADTFTPSKVVVDDAENVYVCIRSITRGAVVFTKDGEFNSYYGANRVEKTGEVLLNNFWKLIMTREQIKRMKRNIPVEISNFDIDSQNFVYTVTENKNTDTDILKKMNSAGTNIFINLGYNEYSFGDPFETFYRQKEYRSQITDVDIGPNGEINLLDLATGRVFQYDEECTLMFIFGGLGNQKGLFTNVSAVESLGTNVYVLDSRKNTITVFKRTEFGAIVQQAVTLANAGRYDEAKEPWLEVLRRDSNYRMAYIGLGNAYLNSGDYENAMDCFYLQSRMGYSDAFKSWRMDFVHDNFNIMAIAALIIIGGIYALTIIRNRKRRKKNKSDKS